ncbi:PaaI family thioesterase [Roseomonas sp. KE2513]|uniref:PaaI family thioesterase n=1 Tax=Roseomonas sp. KE2513 TaxID=2479202 RepID=UPI0018DFAD26|nr:PaaI family thioesterase [Roseomonas sp. KE2513]MBI0539537.1 PaaI family thioesterase [Roseomonas sp. KE2513]
MMMDNPLLEYLGISLTRWTAGKAEFQLDIGPRHLNRQGSLQGGMTATLLDAACGYAGLWTEESQTPGDAVTVMLTISYLAKVQQGRITATGRVTHSGRRLYFSSGELVADDGTIIATAQGSFSRSRPRSGA